MCNFLLAILAIFLPPIAVLLHEGCTANLCINILLTCLGLIPGVIHAWWLILCHEPRTITNIYVQQGHPGQNYGPAPPAYADA